MLRVYGSSDDLIEVDGDVREEFVLFDEDAGDILAFSNGVVLRVQYDVDGFWRIRSLAGHKLVRRREPVEDGDYSDVALIEGSVSWVVHGSEWSLAPPSALVASGPVVQLPALVRP